MKELKNIGLLAVENSAFCREENRDYYKEMAQKYPLLERPIESHNAEAIAEIVVSMGTNTVEKMLEEVNEKAAILNNPDMGRLLLVMVMVNLRKEIKSLEQAVIATIALEMDK
jgi:uncharacterized protein (UPF0128 family)